MRVIDSVTLGRMAITKLGLLGCLWVALSAVPCWSEDSGDTRYYLGLRYGESNPALDAHDVISASLGANLNRYLGLELAADFYELQIKGSAGSKVAEVGVAALMPQVRLRYPFLADRLVPYLIAGGGVALSQLNDVGGPGYTLAGRSESGTSAAPVGSVGAGIEYFVKDDIAFGIEGKYLLSGSKNLEAPGTTTQVDLSAAVLTFGFRLFYPELDPHALEASLANADATRFYFGVQLGGAIPIQNEPFPGVNATPEPPAYGRTLDQLFGFLLGANFGEHLGLELSLQGFETRLGLPDVGTIGEYAVYAGALQPRFRYPLLNGRLQPYVLGGVGMGYGELNDTVQGKGVTVQGNGIGVIGTLAAGIEYFVTSDIAFGFETKYLIDRGHTVRINDGPERSGTLDTIFVSLSLRMFLFQL